MKNRAVKYQVPGTEQHRSMNCASPEFTVVLTQMRTFSSVFQD